MKARDLFEGVIQNKIPTLDIINAIEHLGDEGNGVTKEKLELLLSDFSWYLQDYVDEILKKREADKELLELYNSEKNKRFRNAYVIQEYYEDAGLSENQMVSILEFIGILHSNIERIEYLRSDKVTMAEAIGDSYKKGIPNSFFTEVYEGNLSDSEIYSKVQELTDNFDETKLNLLCNDFDFYLFMVKEYEINYSREEIDEKIKEYQEAGKKIPMLSDRNPSPSQVSGFFKTPEHKKIKKEEDWTKEQLENLKKMNKEWQESKKNILDVEKLMDPYGVELFSLYKLRNLLVDLKRKHTSAVYKFEKPKGSLSPFEYKASPEKSQTFKFFESVNSGEILKLDIHNRIQELTDNYDEDKLNLLCAEFDSYIFVKYENWREKYTMEDIEKRIATYQEKGIKLPVKGDKSSRQRSPFIRDFFLHERFGKPIPDEGYENLLNKAIGHSKYKSDRDVVDDNVLLGGFYVDSKSMPLLHLRDILIDLRRKHTSSVYRFDDKPKDLENNCNHINWRKGNDSLEQFVEALQEHNLINSRETEAIIKDHFKPVREQNREPVPMQWLETLSLLAYMIEQLAKRTNQYINPNNLWSDTVSHFSKNGQTPKNMKQTANRYKQNKSGKPKNYQIIDKIIQKLPD